MDSLSALAMGEMNRGKEMKVFDWEKAANLIRERKPLVASAGLAGDWEYTGGEIYKDGKPVNKDETYTFLASTWTIPELDMDGSVCSCYRMESQSPGWGGDTYWPPEAIAALEGTKAD